MKIPDTLWIKKDKYGKWQVKTRHGLFWYIYSLFCSKTSKKKLLEPLNEQVRKMFNK